jgi:alcohol dehydrogenase class IV
VATLASSYSDALAIESLKMFFKYLPVAYKDPGNINARQIMHDASCMAGMSFTNAILGIVHSMAHQLGGMFGIPHGCANALLLPNVIRFNSKSTGKYIELARAVGKGTSGELAKAIEGLRKSVGVVDSIREWGVEEKIWREKLDAISKNALADPCTGTNPRKPTQDEIRKIYECCYIGTAVDF